MNQLIISILSLISITVFVAVFLFFYLRSVRGEIDEYWGELSLVTGKRLDKIPYLIETIRSEEDDKKIIEDLIRLRSDSWHIVEPTAEKIRIEEEISRNIHKIWNLAKKRPDLNRNMDFLYVKNEFNRIGELVVQAITSYNDKVRHYDRLCDFILLKPFIWAFRYSKLPFFEFER